MVSVKKITSVIIALALLFSLASVAVADGTAPLINGQTKATSFVITAASSMQKAYEMAIVVTGAPTPTVTVTGTAKAYYKSGKIVVPAGLQSSSTPYTIEIVAENEAGKATMSGRVDVMEVATINGYYKKSVSINLKEGYADQAITCAIKGLPTPTTDIETEVSGVMLSNNKLYISSGLTAEDSPYTIKVSASNTIAGTEYTAETIYTLNIYKDGFDETEDFVIPEIVGPEVIELEEGYEERPVFNYTITGTPYPIVTPTGLDGVEFFDGVLTLPLGLDLKTQDYLVRLTASNDYGSDVKNIAIRVVEKIVEGDTGEEGDGGTGGDQGGVQTQGDGDEDTDPTPAPTTSSSGSGGGSSSSMTVDVGGVSIAARGKSDVLTVKPTKENIREILGDFSKLEYVFDMSSYDYEEVKWQIDPRWFEGIADDAAITFMQPAGNVTITGSMMIKLIDKAPKGVVDFRFNGQLTFIIEKGSDRAKWSDEDEPIYIEIPYSGESTENLSIATSQGGEDYPDAEDVSYESGYVTGTVYNTGKYTVK